MRIDKVCILGGTGFVGHHLVARLSAEGRRVRILSRRPQRHRDLLVLPGVTLVAVDVHERGALVGPLQGVDAVINLVGILNSRTLPGQSFRETHVDLPGKIVAACRQAGVRRLLHMSAVNADAARGRSEYLRSKGEGESIVHAGQGDLQVTTFAPSVIFGPGDSFLNRFAGLLRVAPFVFPLACPEARFAPVFVGDVVRAFSTSLEEQSTVGGRYELCGPRILSLRQIVEEVARTLRLRRRIVGLGDRLSRWQARLLEWAPGTPFSRDNYRSLQVDSVCSEDGFARLGMAPTDLDAVIRQSLLRGARDARHAELRRARLLGTLRP